MGGHLLIKGVYADVFNNKLKNLIMKTSVNEISNASSCKLNRANMRKNIIAEVRTALGEAVDEQPNFLTDDFGGMF